MQPNRQDYGLLIALGAVWGSSFLLIKLAVATIPPVTLAAGRILVGALVLAAIVAVRRQSWPRTPRAWLLLAVMGVIGNVVPFSLINWGEIRIDSGLTAILMSTVPLATIILAPAFVRDEPVTAGKLIGVALGMAGVAVLIGPGALVGAHGELLGQIAVTSVSKRRERIRSPPGGTHRSGSGRPLQPAPWRSSPGAPGSCRAPSPVTPASSPTTGAGSSGTLRAWSLRS